MTTCGARARSGCGPARRRTSAASCANARVVDLGDLEPDASRAAAGREVAQEAPEQERPLERRAVGCARGRAATCSRSVREVARARASRSPALANGRKPSMSREFAPTEARAGLT